VTYIYKTLINSFKQAASDARCVLNLATDQRRQWKQVLPYWRQQRKPTAYYGPHTQTSFFMLL